jgi:cytoskeletal protein CcmA (bactofilin family)
MPARRAKRNRLIFFLITDNLQCTAIATIPVGTKTEKKEIEQMGWFQKKQKPNDTPAADYAGDSYSGTTRLGGGLKIRGLIAGSDNVSILGYHEGRIEVEADLDIQTTAQVNGEIKARRIIVAGKAAGTLEATALLRLEQTGEARGEVTTPAISIEEGAVLEGSVKMPGA